MGAKAIVLRLSSPTTFVTQVCIKINIVEKVVVEVEIKIRLDVELLYLRIQKAKKSEQPRLAEKQVSRVQGLRSVIHRAFLPKLALPTCSCLCTLLTTRNRHA
jgi:hypothetical protein